MENLSHQKIIEELLPQKFGKAGKIWVGVLLVFCAVGLIAYIRQLSKGLEVTAMRDYASWGVYISSFVFFAGISLVGSVLTASLRLINVPWRTPLMRIAEMIAVSAIIFTSLVIIVDMGRPDRIFNLFIHGRVQSPIIWDVVVIITFTLVNIFLLYFLLLPDIQILISMKEKTGKFAHTIYKLLGSFWKNTPEQTKINDKAINILSFTIIIMAFAMPTSWLFATVYRPGWDSTNFGVYFISGAFLSGAGAVLIAMYVFRKFYKLENYITEEHFDRISKLVIVLAVLYLYFNINEYLVPAYKMKKADESYLLGLLSGGYAPLFWISVLMSMIIPIFTLLMNKGRKPFPAFVVGILVVIGSWLKRYVIVIPTLLHPLIPMHDVPESYRQYFPTWEEWAITMGSLAGALLIITLIARYYPIVAIQKTINEIDKHHDKA